MVKLSVEMLLAVDGEQMVHSRERVCGTVLRLTSSDKVTEAMVR